MNDPYSAFGPSKPRFPRRPDFVLYPLGKIKYQPYRFNGIYWESMSVLEWRTIAREILEQEDPARAQKVRAADLDDEFGDLVIEDVNVGTPGTLLQKNGEVIDLDTFAKVRVNDLRTNDDVRSFISKASESKNAYRTMKFGASWVPVSSRQKHDPIREFFQERIADPESWKLVCFLLCHALTGRVSVKAILMILNIRFNTGKSVAMLILFRLFGSYAVKVAPQLFHRENIERLNKFLFVHKDCLLIIIDETDSGFRPDIPSLKKITGRDLFANSYSSTFQDQFSVRGMLFIDSNEVLQHRGEASNGIESRLFLLPFGQPVPREQRIWGLEELLTTPENLDTFFSNLLDEHFRWAMGNPLPPKTEAMKRLDLLFRLRQDAIPLFLEHCTRSTESNATQGAQKLNTLEVHRYFVRFCKRLYVDLLKKVRFDRNESGETMTFHEMNLELPLDDHREFKSRVDRIMGEANELNRSAKGYRWVTFVVKELAVMYLNDPRLEKIYGPMDEMIDFLDGVKSDLDTVRAVEGHLETSYGLMKIKTLGFEDTEQPSSNMTALAILQAQSQIE